jgi:actin-related protein
MYDDNLNFDKVTNIIIDLGFKLTKIGFGNEPEPRKIIRTPNFFDYEKFIEDDTLIQMKSTSQNHQSDYSIENNFNFANIKSLMLYKRDLKKLKYEIEEFAYNIFYNILQIKKQQRDKNYVCLLCIDFSLKNCFLEIYELLVKILLENPLILCVRLLPKKILPVFSSGYSSGIVIDVGYLFTTITPINNGFSYTDKIQTISMGASDLEKFLKRSIIEENIILPSNKKKIKNVEVFCKNIIKHLDDLLVRCGICVNKKISSSIFESSNFEENKLFSDQDYSKVDFYKDVQDFQISFLTRVKLGEFFFGNVRNDEINIAYSLLNVILSLNNEDRKKLSQNIILSGGCSMLIGFYRRLIDEINFWIEEIEFIDLKSLHNSNSIKLHKIIFPRNCLTWIGASLISNTEKLNLKPLSILKDDFENFEKEYSSVDQAEVKKSPVERILNLFQ